MSWLLPQANFGFFSARLVFFLHCPCCFRNATCFSFGAILWFFESWSEGEFPLLCRCGQPWRQRRQDSGRRSPGHSPDRTRDGSSRLQDRLAQAVAKKAQVMRYRRPYLWRPIHTAQCIRNNLGLETKKKNHRLSITFVYCIHQRCGYGYNFI